MKYCTHCGRPNHDDNRFCEGCGTPLQMPASFPGADTFSANQQTPLSRSTLPVNDDQTVLLNRAASTGNDDQTVLLNHAAPAGDDDQTVLLNRAVPSGNDDQTVLLNHASPAGNDDQTVLLNRAVPAGDDDQTVLLNRAVPAGNDDQTVLLNQSPESAQKTAGTEPVQPAPMPYNPEHTVSYYGENQAANVVPEPKVPVESGQVPPIPPTEEGKGAEFVPPETSKKGKKPGKKTWLLFLIVGVLVLAGIGAGIWFWLSGNTTASAPLQEALQLGQKYMDDLDYNSAIVAYNDAISIDPQSKDAYMGLAQAYTGIQDYEEAEAAYRQLLEIDQQNAEGYRQLAELYIRLEKLEEAKALLENAVKQTDDEFIKDLYQETSPKAPEFSLAAGEYQEYQEVAITCEKPEYIIHYTTDGSEPTVDSPVYSEPLILTSGKTTVKAVVVSSRGYLSDTASAEYSIRLTPTVIKFADPEMEEVVRNELGISYGDVITTDNTVQIRELSIVGDNYISSAEGSIPVFTEDGYSINSWEQSYRGELTTLEDLKYMPFLRRFHLAWQEKVDVSGISQASRLEELSLIHVGMTSLKPVSGLSNLKKLCVGWNSISDLSPISSLTSLTSLGVWNNQIQDISPVSGLTALTYLDISRNQVSDISAVSGLAGLESLWMYSNQVSDYAPLQGLEQLRVLMIRDNPIEDRSVLQKIFPRLGRTDVDVIDRGEDAE